MGSNHTIADYEDGFYPMLEDWCAHHGVEPPDCMDLDEAVGVVVMREDTIPLGVGFLYPVGNFAFVEGLILKPGLSIKESRLVASDVYESLKGYAKRTGVTKLIAFVKSKGMVKECQRVGFSQVGSPMAQMVHQIN